MCVCRCALEVAFAGDPTSLACDNVLIRFRSMLTCRHNRECRRCIDTWSGVLPFHPKLYARRTDNTFFHLKTYDL